MPQIREQIAMVHLPPSKTLKYLFHVRKTNKTTDFDTKSVVFLYARKALISRSFSHIWVKISDRQGVISRRFMCFLGCFFSFI